MTRPREALWYDANEGAFMYLRTQGAIETYSDQPGDTAEKRTLHMILNITMIRSLVTVQEMDHEKDIPEEKQPQTLQDFFAEYEISVSEGVNAILAIIKDNPIAVIL